MGGGGRFEGKCGSFSKRATGEWVVLKGRKKGDGREVSGKEKNRKDTRAQSADLEERGP